MYGSCTETHYNYVILGVTSPVLQATFGGLGTSGRVEVREGLTHDSGVLLNSLFQIHWSRKLNRLVRLPLKRLWFRAMYRNTLPKDRPLCFVYLGGKYASGDDGFVHYVKSQDSRNRQITAYLI